MLDSIIWLVRINRTINKPTKDTTKKLLYNPNVYPRTSDAIKSFKKQL